MYVTQMIEQVPHAKPYSKRHLESVDQMLLLINEVIGRAPEYNETGLVGVPLNAVLDWWMGTPAGFAAFRHATRSTRCSTRSSRFGASSSAAPLRSTCSTTRRGDGSAPRPRNATRIEQFQYDPRDSTGDSRRGTTTSPDDSSRAPDRSRTPTTTR